MTQPQRSGRVPEIELMKGIAIIGMVLVHVLEGSLSVFENAWTLPGSIPYTLIEFIGGIPAAGAFTFAMGWGAAFSARATVKSFLGRARQLFLLLFAVNFMYAVLPGILDPADFGAFSEHPHALIGFNIYSFASVSMLYFALMKKLEGRIRLKAWISAGIAAAVFIADSLIPPEAYTSGNVWIDTLIGAVIRENHYSWFPLVPWAVFPVMGYWAGLLYRRWKDRKRFALWALGLGAAAVAVSQAVIRAGGLPQGALNPGWVENEADYYALDAWNLLCACGMLCLETALAFGVMTLTRGRLPGVLANMSRNVMRIFLIHWIFVSPLFPVLLRVTDVWLNTGIGLTVLSVVYGIVRLLDKRFPGKKFLGI